MTGASSWLEAPLQRVLDKWEATARRWEVTDEERLGLLGVTGGGPIHEVASYCQQGTEHRIRLLVGLDVAMDNVFGDDARTREWLRRPNMHMGDRTPLEVMTQSPEWIRWMIGALGAAA